MGIKMKKITGIISKIFYAIIIIGILFVIAGPLYTVPANQCAVIMQFGKIVRVDTQPGLKAKIPFMLIAGDREAAEGTVTVRRRDTREQESMPFARFLDLVRDLRARKARDLGEPVKTT